MEYGRIMQCILSDREQRLGWDGHRRGWVRGEEGEQVRLEEGRAERGRTGQLGG